MHTNWWTRVAVGLVAAMVVLLAVVAWQVASLGGEMRQSATTMAWLASHVGNVSTNPSQSSPAGRLPPRE